MVAFPGVAHIAVTVTDLDVSRRWYERLFGTRPVVDERANGYHHVIFRLSEGALFALHKHDRNLEGDRFTEFRPGLDHVGFGCADREELEAWQDRLEQLGISHGGIVDAPYGSGLSFRDPDNIALEFFAPPPKARA